MSHEAVTSRPPDWPVMVMSPVTAVDDVLVLLSARVGLTSEQCALSQT